MLKFSHQEVQIQTSRLLHSPIKLTKDLKVLAESVALSVANNPESKLAIVENVSKIGISKEVKKEVVKVIEEEVQAKEEQKKEIEKVVEKLESNMIETL